MTALLVVVHAFAGYNVGDIVSDQTEIAAIAYSEHGGRVVRVVPPTSTDDRLEDN